MQRQREKASVSVGTAFQKNEYKQSQALHFEAPDFVCAVLFFVAGDLVQQESCGDYNADHGEDPYHTGSHIAEVAYKIHRIEFDYHYAFSFRSSKEVEYQTACDDRGYLS